jgi:hypothetical protein
MVGQVGIKLQISYDYLKQQVDTLTAQADLEPDQSFADRLPKFPQVLHETGLTLRGWE